MRPRTATVWVVLAVFLQACGDDNGGPGRGGDPGPPRAVPPAQLRVSPRVARPGGELVATVVPARGTRVEGGYDYRLEARRHGVWRWLNRDAVFIRIAFVATHERPFRQTIHLPRDLRPGRHRIVKTLRVAGADERVEAAAEFEVRG